MCSLYFLNLLIEITGGIILFNKNNRCTKKINVQFGTLSTVTVLTGEKSTCFKNSKKVEKNLHKNGTEQKFYTKCSTGMNAMTTEDVHPQSHWYKTK